MRFFYNGKGKTYRGEDYNHGEFKPGTSFICLGELGYMDMDEEGCVEEVK
jgi:hypothetical protein